MKHYVVCLAAILAGACSSMRPIVFRASSADRVGSKGAFNVARGARADAFL